MVRSQRPEKCDGRSKEQVAATGGEKQLEPTSIKKPQKTAKPQGVRLLDAKGGQSRAKLQFGFAL